MFKTKDIGQELDVREEKDYCGKQSKVDFQDVFAQPQAVPQAHNTVIYLKVTSIPMMMLTMMIFLTPILKMLKNFFKGKESQVAIIIIYVPFQNVCRQIVFD